MTKPSPLGMAAFIIDGYLLRSHTVVCAGYVRIDEVPDFIDCMTTLSASFVFPLGLVTKNWSSSLH